jgi:hypothetical protein
MNISFYYLPIVPPPSEFCGLDENGQFYCHPNAFDRPLLQQAKKARVVLFVRCPEGIVPLVPLSWIEEVFADNFEQLNSLDVLKGAFRGFIKAGAKAHHFPLADVSLPGDPPFTNAMLRTLAGNKN